MAGLDATFMLIPERRPCFMAGRKALFHKWIVDGRNNTTVGLIELEDGSVHKVLPDRITFCDNEIQQYVFPKNRPKNSRNLIPLDELIQKAKTGEPVFLVSKLSGIQEWAFVRSEGVTVSITDEVLPIVIFENGRRFRQNNYGITWHTYRKKPER